MNLYQWANKWGIPPAAIAEYRQLVGIDMVQPITDAKSEKGVVQRVRLEAAQKGHILWRNNVGAVKDEAGNFFRYGLANDSAAMNKRVKSSDLIGIRDGGQFLARETKPPGWRYTGTPREEGQLRFLELVLSLGGDAAFATGEGTL